MHSHLSRSWIVFMLLGVMGAPLTAQPNPRVTANNPQPVLAAQRPKSQPLKLSPESATQFAKAFQSFFGIDTLRTVTQMQLKGTSSGVDITMGVQQQTVISTSGRFRTELEFKDSASPGRKYQVICDGKKLWIYRPDTQEFSVQTYQQFDNSDDAILIGLATGLHLSMPPELKQLLEPGGVFNPQDLQDAGIQDLGRKAAENGKPYRVYSLSDLQDSAYILEFWINPQTTQIEIFQLAGKEKGTQIELQETLVQYQKNPSIQSNLFTFQPPAGVRQVPKLSIDP
jgi:outer membrane lipoprotein-sorting protein